MSPYRGPVAAFAASFLLYLLTLAPGVTWGDSAKLVLLSWPPDPGILPGEHHLRNLAGALFHLLPWGDPAWRQNLLSATCAAGAVALAWSMTRRLTGSAWAASIAAGALAVSHTFWHLAVIAESYAPAALLFGLQVRAALRWDETGDLRALRGFALSLGLGAANHVLAFVLTVPFALFFLLRARGKPRPDLREAAIWAGAFLLGYAPVLWAVARHAPVHGLGESIAGVLDLEATQYLRPGVADVVSAFAKRAVAIAAQAPGWGGLLAFAGLWAARRRHPALFLLGGGTVAWLWLFTSMHVDLRTVYRLVPAYWILALFAGVGWREVELRRAPRTAWAAVSLALVLALPPLVYAAAPGLVRAWRVEGGPVAAMRRLPYRDSLRYFLVPWKQGYDEPERFARAALAQAAPDGVIVADFTPLMVLNYAQQVLGVEPGVEVAPTESDRVKGPGLAAFAARRRSGGKRVFLADRYPGAEKLEPRGMLWEATGD